MNLDQFERNLLEIIGRPTQVRPFVCEGSPLECQAFIVGFNPATEMQAGFWDFWRAGYGFDKSAWFDEYQRDRNARGKSAISPSRRIIERVAAAAAPVRILETNIFARPTAAKTDLAIEHKNSAPFRFLLDALRPAVIVAHGTDAHRALAGLGGIRVMNVAHFSRGWSYEAAQNLGAELRNYTT